MEPNAESSILVVGAGPTGLALALALHRAGVSCRLIDKAAGRHATSRALGIHARTLELLDSFDLASRFIASGHRVEGIEFLEANKSAGGFSMHHNGSAYPFILILPQSRTEQLLEEELSRCGQALERPAELLALSREGSGFRCRIQEPDGVIKESNYRFVVGCDGAHSAVRHCLGWEFEGSSYPEFFGLADATVEGDLPTDRISAFLHAEGRVLFFPMGGTRFRVVACLEGAAAEQGVTLEELQEVLDRRVRPGLTLCDPTWLTGFRTHHRIVGRMGSGGVFLAGDAAHIHSPAGGQGMNTGIQDAINLGWKLGCVVRGDAPESLLASYEAERLPVAREVLAGTDRLERFTSETAGWQAVARRILLRRLEAWQAAECRIAAKISQIALNYRASSLSLDNRLPKVFGGGLRAGDRIPDAELVAPGGKRSRIYELLRQPGFHLFLAPRTSRPRCAGSFGAARQFADALATDFRDQLNVHWVLAPLLSMSLRQELPVHWVDAGGSVTHALGIFPCGAVLVRPDCYSALVDGNFDAGAARLSTLAYWI